ncbi:amidase [Paenibacillus glufosinatiresistens]|uniref:amidase n=1 Tax=Paenibacillus glufosinatiresistens TaxID=3070657 RepID=UPI00286EA22A|nr:amidase [Paenibacillus sp. YX.27]
MGLDNRYCAFMDPQLQVPPTGTGALDGLSFAVKDVFAVAGHSSSAGNPDWLRTHGPSLRHAAAVEKLLRHGAELRGAAHTDELMYSVGGENAHYGTPVNPNGPGRIPGGSSSGSAVAVASGAVDAALGTDTGGSIRVPAAYCGVFGFRPTHGAVEMDGVIPLAPSFDTVGWLARTPELLLRIGRTLLPEPAEAEGRTGAADPPFWPDRIILPAEAWALAEPSAAAALRLAAGRLMQTAGPAAVSGIRPAAEEIAVTTGGLAAWMEIFRELQGYEIWQTHGEWISAEQPVFGPDIAARFRWAASLPESGQAAARTARAAIAGHIRSLLGPSGCLALPTVPGPAPLLGGDAGQLERNRSGALSLCCIAGLTGLPQVTLPVEGPDGLPVGLSVIAGPGRDLDLLAWAMSLPALCPF